MKKESNPPPSFSKPSPPPIPPKSRAAHIDWLQWAKANMENNNLQQETINKIVEIVKARLGDMPEPELYRFYADILDDRIKIVNKETKE